MEIIWKDITREEIMTKRTLKIYRQPNSYNRSEIRLSSEWLRKSGFEIGDYIRITYDNAVIVIKKTGGVNETQEQKAQGHSI